MTVELFHITSLDRAISIICSGRYKPAYTNPVARDSGLNAGLVGRPLSGQEFEASGVRLLLEFNGSLQPMGTFPLTVGYIYDELPWRVVVPYGTQADLTMVGIELGDDVQWHDALPKPPWWVVGGRLKETWRSRAAQTLQEEILGILQKRPSLTVG